MRNRKASTPTRARSLRRAANTYRAQVVQLIESSEAPGISDGEAECMCAGFVAGYRTALREAQHGGKR